MKEKAYKIKCFRWFWKCFQKCLTITCGDGSIDVKGERVRGYMKMIKGCKYIYFDIGSTLVDESDCYKQRYYEAIKNTDIPYEAFADKVVEFSKENLKGDHEAVKHFGLSLPKWHKELEKLYPETKTILDLLFNKGYKLGVIANQSHGTTERLKNWGILHYFDVVMASAEESIAKPDIVFFNRALFKAKCPPENAVMVGDRIDNDIVPANKIGMVTIWVKQGFGRYAQPKSDQEKADFVVDSLGEINALFP